MTFKFYPEEKQYSDRVNDGIMFYSRTGNGEKMAVEVFEGYLYRRFEMSESGTVHG